jgi:hypothetical protein
MKTLEELKEDLEELYLKIGSFSNSREEMEQLIDEASELEDQIYQLEHPPEPKLSLREFEDYYNVETRYECFCDEHGYVGFYDEYLGAHYDRYLSTENFTF